MEKKAMETIIKEVAELASRSVDEVIEDYLEQPYIPQGKLVMTVLSGAYPITDEGDQVLYDIIMAAYSLGYTRGTKYGTVYAEGKILPQTQH